MTTGWQKQSMLQRPNTEKDLSRLTWKRTLIIIQNRLVPLPGNLQNLMTRDGKPWNFPTFIERAGLNIDGLVWFRKTVDIPKHLAGKSALLSLGPIDDSDETWVNGTKVGSISKNYLKERVYTVPFGTLKPGKNIIAVRVEDTGNRGGIYGKVEALFIQTGAEKTSIAGSWKYEVEKEYGSADQLIFKESSIAEVFVKSYLNKQEPV